MATDDRAEQLSRLRAEVDLSLSSFLRRASFLTPALGAGGLMPAPGQPAPVAASGDVAASGGAASTGVLPGQAILPDNERSIRALAKDIKRLISEDIRRGLAV